VTPAQAAQFLELSGQAFVGLLQSASPAAASWRQGPQEWCINECVGHVIEAERRGFAGRIRIILHEPRPHLETWDQPEVARLRRDCEKKPQDLIKEFEPLRRESIGLLRSMRDDQLTRDGLHPNVGVLTVNDLIHEWVHHDGNHLRQAIANMQAYVWPDMGNARRFSSA
jgi:hypothetical protein